MKEYVVLSIELNALVFDFRSISDDEKSFVNSNNFYKDSLFYDLKKYKKNSDKIISIEAGINDIN